jgi:glucose/arabinose dehydrogenase
MRNIIRTATVLVALASAGVPGFAEDANAPLLKGKAAFGSWRDDRPGIRRVLTMRDLPPIGKSTANFSEVAAMPAGAKPQVPSGFTVEMVASGLAGPRAIRLAPNGDLFVADSMSNTVRVLRVPAGSASVAKNEVFADGLYQPYGIAFYPPGPTPEWVYVANSDGVVRFAYKSGDLTASAKPEQIITRIPWVHHWTRDIVFSVDGKRLLLAVGSGSNVALDMFPQPLSKGGLQAWITNKPLGATWDTEERRADVLSFDPDGKNEKIVATGLRNCAGLAIQPATGLPWCVVNERDELGDNTPLEYATAVRDGAFYGWPGTTSDPMRIRAIRARGPI